MESCTAVVLAPEVRVSLSPMEGELCVRQGSSGTFGMAATGQAVWSGARALAQVLLQPQDAALEAALQALLPRPEEGEGVANDEVMVLEIGAGCSGLPGLACAALGHTDVVLTDGGQQEVEQLADNVETNRAFLRGGACRCQELDWSQTDEAVANTVALTGDKKIVVLGADILYAETHEHVLAFLAQLAQTGRLAGVVLCNTNRKAVHLFRRACVRWFRLEAFVHAGDEVLWVLTPTDPTTTS